MRRIAVPSRGLSGGFYAAVPTGSFYGFALYSAALKNALGLSQGALDNLNTLPYLFGVFSPIWGHMTTRCTESACRTVMC